MKTRTVTSIAGWMGAALMPLGAATYGGGAVDLRLHAPATQVTPGDVISVELIASTDSVAALDVVAFDAIITWDQATLNLEDAAPIFPADWLNAGFPAVVSINQGIAVSFVGIPSNDGDALYQGLALPGESVPVSDGSEQRLARFDFRALQESAGTQISLAPNVGGFSTRTLTFGNQNITGSLTDSQSISITTGFGALSLEVPAGCLSGPGGQIAVQLWMRDLTQAANGYQAYVRFDDDALNYRGDLSAYPGTDPFPQHIIPLANADNISDPDVLHLQGASIASTQADALLVTLVFDVIQECTADGLSFTIYNNPPLTFESTLSAGGFPITTTLVPTAALQLDDDGPQLVGVPGDATVQCPNPIPPPANVTANDNCDGAVSVQLDTTTDLDGCNGTGAVTRTWTAVDSCGNSSSETQVITLVDDVPPVALCQDVTLQLNASGQATLAPEDLDDGSNDACGEITFAASQTAFDCSNLGINSVQLTVTDACNHSSNCTATVTVVDQLAPDAICQNFTVQLDANGQATITPAQVDNGSTDNCGITTRTLSRTSFTCTDIGAQSVTLTVADASGNSDTCTATVTVVDQLAPDAICQNITVQLDANGQATITPAQVDNGSSDNCGITTRTLSRTSFTCADIGAQSVTLTVADASGNSDTCTATVTVVDQLAPDAICQNITVQLDANGQATITPAQVDNGSSDNCGITTRTLSRTSFTCADAGPQSVTLTVADASGNSDSCTATVTVEDNVPPVALCQDISVQLDENGQATITPAQINAGSKDACGIATLGLDRTTFGCADRGSNTVTLTVIDVNGNSSTCTATVTVQDHPDPRTCNLGDMNCDGIVSVGDIGPFVLAVTNPAQYAAQFPNCDINRGDINGDGFITVGDIGPFVALVVGS